MYKLGKLNSTVKTIVLYKYIISKYVKIKNITVINNKLVTIIVCIGNLKSIVIFVANLHP